MAVITKWRNLETRPGTKTCQLFVRGRNLKVWPLVQPIVMGNRTVEEMAKDYRLADDQVREALAFFYENESAILREVEAEGEYLRREGLLST